MLQEAMKPPTRPFSLEKLKRAVRLYEGCKNMLGIVPLTIAGYPDSLDWKKDEGLRTFLQQWGRAINSDSVMVLTGYPDGNNQPYDFFMDVFEPNGTDNTDRNLPGGVSTMCGNGVRAVAAYIRIYRPGATEARIMTRSGLRTVGVDADRDLYSVNMGKFTSSYKDLAQYVNDGLITTNRNGEYIDSPIPQDIVRQLNVFTSVTSWNIGLNGDRAKDGSIDGEPHVVIILPKEQFATINNQREFAVAAGPIITKALRYFPHEINVNFISLRGGDGRKQIIWNTTHERNLGNDADHSVTQACGTGSTVAASVLFRKGLVSTNQYVEVINTGGQLEISLCPDDNLIMNGPANPVS